MEVISKKEMYFMTKCDGFKKTLVAGTDISLIFSIFATLICISVAFLFKNMSPLWILSLWFIPFIMSTIDAFLPSTKEMAMIVVIPEILNNEELQKIPKEMVDITHIGLNKLKEIITKKEGQ